MVGSIRLQTIGQRMVARFTVATSRAYHDAQGMAVIETTWHNVSAWQGKGLECIDKIKKGDKIYVVGRLKYSSFIGSDGVERNSTEIVATKINILDLDDALQNEM